MNTSIIHVLAFLILAVICTTSAEPVRVESVTIAHAEFVFQWGAGSSGVKEIAAPFLAPSTLPILRRIPSHNEDHPLAMEVQRIVRSVKKTKEKPVESFVRSGTGVFLICEAQKSEGVYIILIPYRGEEVWVTHGYSIDKGRNLFRFGKTPTQGDQAKIPVATVAAPRLRGLIRDAVKEAMNKAGSIVEKLDR